MDQFGIGAAIQGAVSVMLRCARQTGRTTALIASVKPGDRIIFSNQQEALRVKRMLRERGVDAICVVVNPANIEPLFSMQPMAGRTYFDHSWLEEYYCHEIRHAALRIDGLTQGLSRTPEDGAELHRHRTMFAAKFP